MTIIFVSSGKSTTAEYNKVCICIVLCNISSNLEIAEKLIDMDIVEEVVQMISLVHIICFSQIIELILTLTFLQGI